VRRWRAFDVLGEAETRGSESDQSPESGPSDAVRKELARRLVAKGYDPYSASSCTGHRSKAVLPPANASKTASAAF